MIYTCFQIYSVRAWSSYIRLKLGYLPPISIWLT